MRRTLTDDRGGLLLLAFVALTALLILNDPAPAAASTQSCRVTGSYGSTRGCTALERYGQCLTNAFSSYHDCLKFSRRRTGLKRFGRRAACEIGVQVDLFACHLGLPYYLYSQIKQT